MEGFRSKTNRYDLERGPIPHSYIDDDNVAWEEAEKVAERMKSASAEHRADEAFHRQTAAEADKPKKGLWRWIEKKFPPSPEELIIRNNARLTFTGLAEESAEQAKEAERQVLQNYEDKERIKRRILIVDDEAALLRTYGNFFKKLGYEVFLAGTKEEALRMVQVNKPAIAIVDYNLHVRDEKGKSIREDKGTDVAEEMRFSDPNLITTIISTHKIENHGIIKGEKDFWEKIGSHIESLLEEKYGK